MRPNLYEAKLCGRRRGHAASAAPLECDDLTVQLQRFRSYAGTPRNASGMHDRRVIEAVKTASGVYNRSHWWWWRELLGVRRRVRLGRRWRVLLLIEPTLHSTQRWVSLLALRIFKNTRNLKRQHSLIASL